MFFFFFHENIKLLGDENIFGQNDNNPYLVIVAMISLSTRTQK